MSRNLIRHPIRCMLLLGLLACAKLSWAQARIELGASANQLSRMAIAVLRPAYARLDIELAVHELPLRRALQMAESGAMDADLMRLAAVLAASPKLIRVDEPVAELVLSAYGLGNCPKALTASDLSRLKFSYERGIRAIELSLPAGNLMATSHTREAFKAMDHGLVDFVIAPEFDADLVLLTKASRPWCKVPTPIATMPLYHALNLRHAALAARLEAVLKEMAKRGEIAALWSAEAARARAQAQLVDKQEY